jgi:hypothetical protein
MRVVHVSGSRCRHRVRKGRARRPGTVPLRDGQRQVVDGTPHRDVQVPCPDRVEGLEMLLLPACADVADTGVLSQEHELTPVSQVLGGCDVDDRSGTRSGDVDLECPG